MFSYNFLLKKLIINYIINSYKFNMASVISNNSFSENSYQGMSHHDNQTYNLQQEENDDHYSYDNSDLSFQIVEPKASHYVDDNSTIPTVDSRRKRVRRAIQSMKDHDKGYHAIQNNDGEIILEYYETSSCPGCKIRDASTGISYDQYRTGSDAEDLFFKVSYCGNKGTGHILFFSSPDEYERFFKVDLHNNAKIAWAEKQKKVLKKYGY